MRGSAVFFRLPQSGGRWIVLQGTISNITDTAVVVREKYFGGQSTIPHNWLIMYDWSKALAASKSLPAA